MDTGVGGSHCRQEWSVVSLPAFNGQLYTHAYAASPG